QSRAKDFIAQHGEQIIVNELEVPHLAGLPDTKIETHTRRRYWTDLELQFVKEHYMTKSTRWIAAALRRKPLDVNNKLTQMYKKGLPRKRSRSGEVVEG